CFPTRRSSDLYTGATRAIVPWSPPSAVSPLDELDLRLTQSCRVGKKQSRATRFFRQYDRRTYSSRVADRWRSARSLLCRARDADVGLSGGRRDGIPLRRRAPGAPPRRRGHLAASCHRAV